MSVIAATCSPKRLSSDLVRFNSTRARLLSARTAARILPSVIGGPGGCLDWFICRYGQRCGWADSGFPSGLKPRHSPVVRFSMDSSLFIHNSQQPDIAGVLTTVPGTFPTIALTLHFSLSWQTLSIPSPADEYFPVVENGQSPTLPSTRILENLPLMSWKTAVPKTTSPRQDIRASAHDGVESANNATRATTQSFTRGFLLASLVIRQSQSI